ncbi:lactonase family protein [Pinibacter soli]|uniref:Lactonase family protein n=1 Tax=Pinibacter soli TaxID=3044211 RepID=A0ABT6R965_9BACT|nr:lactonase family protein [Pinibacter soli]MDI3319100.1 lactonase family protein [Pinibacter soli]
MKNPLTPITVLTIIALLSFSGAFAQKKKKKSTAHKQSSTKPASTASSASPSEPYLLLGTYTFSGKSKGIYVYKFDAVTGEATEVNNVPSSNPSFLALSPDRKTVFAVNEDKGPGAVSSYAFDKKDGALSFINTEPTSGENPCYVATSKNGKFIAVANYSSGNYLIYPVEKDGSIGEPVEKIKDEGTGPNTKRQEKPHAHATVFSPDNKYLFVNDLGTDKIMVYHFNASTGSLTPANTPFVKVKPGSGPRHMTFDASGKFAYLMTELSGEVVVYKYNEGQFKEVQTISSHPADFKGAIGSADIHISPDGNFLYASNRGDANSIAIFKRDAATGKLTSVGFQPTLGVTPRNFNFDPSGNFLLVAHQQSDNVVIFKVDKKTGLLTDTGKRINVGSPVCVFWVK